MFINYFMIVLPYQLYDNKFKIKCQPPNPLDSVTSLEDLKIPSGNCPQALKGDIKA